MTRIGTELRDSCSKVVYITDPNLFCDKEVMDYQRAREHFTSLGSNKHYC